MVQWTDKPVVKPKTPAPEERKPIAVSRPAVKARKGRMAGVLQAVTVCALFGLLVTGIFVFKESTAAAPEAVAKKTAPEHDVATGRIVIKDEAHCRELGFDNQSGKMVQRGEVSCHDVPAYNGAATPSLYRHPTNRLDAIRRSFAQ